MEFTDLALRLAVAAICGAVVGFEREQQQKPAGLRTHMLVAIGSAAFTMATLQLEHLDGQKSSGPTLQMDPSRVIQGIAGGIGFLGAGAIIRSKGSVHGLTTAATIWVVGAVGICCGLGNYLLAVTTAILVVAIAGMMGMVEGWLFSHKPHPSTGDSKGPTGTPANLPEEDPEAETDNTLHPLE